MRQIMKIHKKPNVMAYFALGAEVASTATGATKAAAAAAAVSLVSRVLPISAVLLLSWFITCQLNSFTLTRLSCRFPATNINKTDNTQRQQLLNESKAAPGGRWPAAKARSAQVVDFDA